MKKCKEPKDKINKSKIKLDDDAIQIKHEDNKKKTVENKIKNDDVKIIFKLEELKSELKYKQQLKQKEMEQRSNNWKLSNEYQIHVKPKKVKSKNSLNTISCDTKLALKYQEIYDTKKDTPINASKPQLGIKELEINREIIEQTKETDQKIIEGKFKYKEKEVKCIEVEIKNKKTTIKDKGKTEEHRIENIHHVKSEIFGDTKIQGINDKKIKENTKIQKPKNNAKYNKKSNSKDLLGYLGLVTEAANGIHENSK